jgi:hypothetical protein
VKLSPLVGGALAAAVLAALTVWLFTRVPGLWVWGAFIGWASYDQSGANGRALLTSSVCMVFGVVMAWLVALTVASGVLALQSAFASAVAAGVASFFIVYVSRVPAFANVPATFYGFASSFAFLLMMPATFSMTAMTGATFSNVLVCVSISLLVGSLLGVVHQQLASLLTGARHSEVSTPVRLTPLKGPP